MSTRTAARRPVRRPAWLGGATRGTVTAIVVVALSLGGVAWAWYGPGEGRATVSTAGVGALSAKVAPIDALAPGVKIPVSIAIDNRTGSPVTITGITVGRVKLARPGIGPCDPAVVTLHPDFTSALTAPPGRSTASATASMRADAPDGCQGAAFTLSLVVTGTF